MLEFDPLADQRIHGEVSRARGHRCTCPGSCSHSSGWPDDCRRAVGRLRSVRSIDRPCVTAMMGICWPAGASFASHISNSVWRASLALHGLRAVSPVARPDSCRSRRAMPDHQLTLAGANWVPASDCQRPFSFPDYCRSPFKLSQCCGRTCSGSQARARTNGRRGGTRARPHQRD